MGPGRAVVGLVVLSAVLLAVGCGKENVAESNEPQTTTLRRGVEVEVAPLLTISSGGSKVGERIPLVVTKDVLDEEGRVALPAGTIAWAEVTRSRGATTFTALANQPARLEIRFDYAEGPDGVAVPLCADAAAPEKPIELTRADSSRPKARQGQSDLLANPKVQETLQAYLQLMENGEAPKVQMDQELRQALLNELGTAPPSKESMDALETLLRRAKAGDVSNLAPSEVLLAVAAAQQVVGLLDSAGDRLAGMLKGANIRIWAGTPLKAFVAHDTTLPLAKPKGPEKKAG
ncbi:MAG: hypothetical protein D6724_05705 [Armatimonadetes bacterium]|nr:MAG: hypothetical protein D6724_05705 [Armatimonadota bacterium]